ncbi:Predicted O-methyltransferase YrrM [Muriicola jejuensis]|uniref:Methyltransferase n=1 Tax=Muriicola jejuensis TaxID=504488 RepID=A0A6P0UBM1_9FLAO|nr:O-methyltransferase [Muriicola jejuensis]NER09279.1 methyltransferase [Muriicola jejuensis]SMP09804.1 Predicted O-methyltransferase YrrM [Muriicola jejuensis]
MHFLSESLQGYITEHSENEPEYLQALSRETHLKVLQPRMITGHYQGRVLSMLSKLISPFRILEIGTYTGYSALCLAEGLRPGGELHTIDINEELQGIQRKYFDLSGYGKQIKQYVGDALDIIPGLDLQFDLIFIDAEKKEYSRYFEAVLPRTKQGGIILSDNVLWSGKVIEPLDPTDKATRALLDYNDMLKRDPRVETVMLPIRDGLTLSRVRSDR